MSFKDIIKKSILENFANTSFSVKEVIYYLSVSVIVGFFIFLIYRVVCKRGFYSKAFSVSLMIMPVITATIIITIQTSVVVSLGMVGALSIVRFRTALKNPLDLIFMFWSISMGIVAGAGLPVIAGVMSLLVAIILLTTELIPMGRCGKLLNVCTQEEISSVSEIVRKYDSKTKIKSQSYNGKYTSVLYVISAKCGDELFDELKNDEKIISFSIVEQDEQQF